MLAASSKGLPIPFTLCLFDLLSYRTARAQTNDKRVESARLRLEHPIGAVQSPPLFPLNNNDQRFFVSETVKVAL